jgi:hypothetical protein
MSIPKNISNLNVLTGIIWCRGDEAALWGWQHLGLNHSWKGFEFELWSMILTKEALQPRSGALQGLHPYEHIPQQNRKMAMMWCRLDEIRHRIVPGRKSKSEAGHSWIVSIGLPWKRGDFPDVRLGLLLFILYILN